MLANLPPLLFLGPMVGAVLVYLFLRMQVWSKPDAESVASHGLWVGIIGWFASSLQGSMSAGILRANPMGSNTPATPDQIFTALSWPILAALSVHALGQVSYPAPKAPRRYAELTVRRIRDFLPRNLAWTTLAIFAYAAVAIAWIATLPAHTPVPPSPPPQQPSSQQPYPQESFPQNNSYMGQDGRIPGWELAAWLGGALLVLTIGTWLVLILIARRRQLETLDGDDNRVLRTIATNRLLRTVATIAAGLASIAGNFATQPAPGAQWQSSWLNYLGAINFAVLLVMWWWPVPSLPSLLTTGKTTSTKTLRTDPRTHGAARLSLSIGAALGVVGGLALLAGWASMLIPEPSLRPLMLPGLVAFVAAMVLLAIVAGEMMLGRNYGTAEAPRRWPHQPVSRGLLSFAFASAAVFAVVITLTAAGQALLLPSTPTWPTALALSIVVALAAGGAVLAVRRRTGIDESGGNRGLDAALRAISLYRIVRMAAAYTLAQSAVLLLTTAEAWAALFPAFNRIAPSPTILTGALLGAIAAIVAVTPVRSLFRGIPRGSSVQQEEPSQ